MALIPITPPSAEPLSLEDVKLHLRVDVADDDALIEGLIETARSAAEARTGRALMPQTWKLLLPDFPRAGHRSLDVIAIPRPPFASVVSIDYINTDGNLSAMPVADYEVFYRQLNVCVRPSFDLSFWPQCRREEGAVSITFLCGYQDADHVPAPIKAWMKCFIATLYENREAVVRGEAATSTFMPRGYVDGLLDQYVVPAFA